MSIVLRLLEADNRKMRDALIACEELFEKALPKFNWGASALDAEAITLLNEVPAKVHAALRAHAILSAARSMGDT